MWRDRKTALGSFNTIGRWCKDGTSENSPTEIATRCTAAILCLLPVFDSRGVGLRFCAALDASIRDGNTIAIRAADVATT